MIIAQPQYIKDEFVFTEAPFESCHAATIVDAGDGHLIAAWFAGKHEGNADVGIWVSHHMGDFWSAPIEVAAGADSLGQPTACWNPVLFKSRAGKLFLHYKVGKSPREWWAEVIVSDDKGSTWSKPKKLPENMLGPIKNKPLQLANGDILYPSSTESIDDKKWRIHLEKSDSLGNNWKRIAIDNNNFNAIQPSILSYKDNRLQLLARSRNNKIVSSWSYDNGKNWTALDPTHLPNPNSGSDAVTLSNGLQLLVYNPLLAGKNWWEGRSVLKLASSTDGINWEEVHTLEEKEKGEYSYPAIIQSADGFIHMVYTYDRKCIKYIKFKP
ncbi:exo-alpha-sialidase [Olivibacter sp. SDN3]|nr:exo-alpha-sialidase [Olivibacter sp. SDN3]